MAYKKSFKLKSITYVRDGDCLLTQLARKEKIPRQTLFRWIKIYENLGEKGLENRKAGAKGKPINPEIEKVILNLWQKRKRSVYRMRLDLKMNGHILSERQIRKIYNKNKLKM